MTRARASAAFIASDDPPSVRYLLQLNRAFSPLQHALGVDVEQLEVLLHAKLVLEGRHQRDGAALGMIKNAGMGLMLLMYLFLGTIAGSFAFIDDDLMRFVNIFATLSFGMLLLPLLVDFAAILLDTDDVKMLSPLPIDDRTVLALRVTHIGVYLLALMICLGLAPAIMGSIVYNPLIVLPSVALALLQVAALALSGVLVLYLLALKTLDLSRFRDAMVYVQVGGFLGFYLLTQIGPHLGRRFTFLADMLEHRELLLLWPPAACGALARLLEGQGGGLEASVAAVGWTVTLGLVAWAAWLGRHGFVARLAEIESAGGAPRAKAPRHGLTGRLATRVPRDGMERAGWSFFLSLCASERQFKLRTMPMLVVSVVPFAMVFLMRKDDGFDPLWMCLPYAPYLLLFIAPGIWEASRFSETWKGRQVFDVLTSEERREFVRGARRAQIVRYVVLPTLIVVPLAMAVSGVDKGFDLLLASEVAFLAAVRITGWFDFEPFTEKFSQANARSNFALMFAASLIVISLVGAQVGLSYVPFAIPVLSIIALPLVPRAWRELPEKSERKRPRRRRAVA